MRIRHFLVILLAAASLGGCLSISQEPCEALAAMCVDGDVWVCRADGSGWDPEMACPDGRCIDGRCEIEAPAPIDVNPTGADIGE